MIEASQKSGPQISFWVRLIHAFVPATEKDYGYYNLYETGLVGIELQHRYSPQIAYTAHDM